MAREEKRFELNPVDDPVDPKVPVIRLENRETLHRDKPVRLQAPSPEAQVSQRLELPAREDFESRTHQPGIEALVENEAVDPDFMEHDWGKDSTRRNRLPRGWFAVIGIVLSCGVLWSIYGVKQANAKAGQIRIATKAVLENDAEEVLEAGQLIDGIDAAARKFFDCTSVDALARLVRHPQPFRPLTEHYYQGKPVSAKHAISSDLFNPFTVATTVELADHAIRNLIIEITGSGGSRIDWETLVCYQPVKCGDFALNRPAGVPLDFRVYVETDNFFSHEFAA